MSTEDRTGHVLVVDDEEKNRRLVTDLLEAKGHRITQAVDGEDALARVAEEPPDAILLDVMMPKFDGFEVCTRLKADDATAPIPIIIVTALQDRDSRLRGIEAGANDFLTKPIDAHDVVLRTGNAVRSKHLYDRVQESLEELRRLEDLRDNLTHMIVHDMRTPLTGIRGFLQLVMMMAGETIDPDSGEKIERSLAQTDVLIEMISALLDVSKLESGEMFLDREDCDLREVVRAAMDSVPAPAREQEVSFDEGDQQIMVSCDREITRRIIVNLVGNAIRFIADDGRVRVELESGTQPEVPSGAREADCVPGTGLVTVRVIDDGPGIAPEYREKVFEKFGQVEARQERKKYSTGLGLTFCKLAVEAHGGEIGVDSVVGEGSTFWFTLPVGDATGSPERSEGSGLRPRNADA